MKKYGISFIAVLFLAALVTACGNKAGTPAEATPAPVPGSVVAEGHLVPAENLTLAFAARGRVSDVLVKKGDRVTKGQVLMRLGDRQQAEAGHAGALLALASARLDFDALVRTAGLGRAQAWQAYMQAQKTRGAAQHAWDQLDPTSIQTDIDDAQADVATRKTDLENAQKDFDKYSNLPADNSTRKSYEDKLRTAQSSYDETVRKVEDLTNNRDAVRAALDAALAAEAEAKRSYENTQNGADAEKLLLAQYRLDNAKAEVAAAQNALDSYDLKAPFDGSVVDTNVSAGQMVGPETWAVVVADFSQWYVDTSDLTEQDVVNVSLGQKVNVTADALPGAAMTGVVEEIGNVSSTQGGDVVYKVHIRLENPDPRLRWGMTMEVTFP